ncbi:MAG: hypothetical protein WHT29_06600 [Bacteroidales bacterium]
MKFLGYLLLTFAIYYLLKALFRLAKLLFSSLYHNNSSDSGEKSIKIEGKPKRFTVQSKEKGEYVDYEEIK